MMSCVIDALYRARSAGLTFPTGAHEEPQRAASVPAVAHGTHCEHPHTRAHAWLGPWCAQRARALAQLASVAETCGVVTESGLVATADVPHDTASVSASSATCTSPERANTRA